MGGEARILERRRQTPKAYRGIYDRAIRGKSRTAAVHAFCLECCGYQINEVYSCPAKECPLWPYRPTARVPHKQPESVCTENTGQKSGRLALEGRGDKKQGLTVLGFKVKK